MDKMDNKPWHNDETFLARWMEGKLSEDEKKIFDRTEDAQFFRDILLAMKGVRKVSYDPVQHLERFHESLVNQPKSTNRHLYWYAIPLAACVLLLIGFFLGSGTSYKTGYGQQLAVWLPDSSKVILNANSALSFQSYNWQKERTVNLVGEAVFDVNKGTDFMVQSKNGNIQVLGTTFNVKSRGTRLDVTCYSGKVAVSSDMINTQIMEGNALAIQGGKIIYQSEITQKEPLWSKGETRLINVSVAEALDELQHIFGIQIEKNNPVPNLTFNGTFPHSDPELAIRLVLEPLDIQYAFDSMNNILTIEP
jgi:transmembrane sensor